MSEESRQYRASDEAETIKFREQTNSALKILEIGHKAIHEVITGMNMSLNEFKVQLVQKVDVVQGKIEKHDDRLARIETSLGMMVKVAWVIVVASAGVVVAAFWKLVLK